MNDVDQRFADLCASWPDALRKEPPIHQGADEEKCQRYHSRAIKDGGKLWTNGVEPGPPPVYHIALGDDDDPDDPAVLAAINAAILRMNIEYKLQEVRKGYWVDLTEATGHVVFGVTAKHRQRQLMKMN